MTDQRLIDALVKRVQDGARELELKACRAINGDVSGLAARLHAVRSEAQEHCTTVAHLAGLLDQPTPERRAAALAALDLPQEPS